MSLAGTLFRLHPTINRLGRNVQSRFFPGSLEAEIRLLPFIVPPDRTAIDVGANVGVYTQALAKLAKNVISIEANPDIASDLRRMFRDNVRIINVAASSGEGIVELRTPMIGSRGGGLSTVESCNSLAGERFSAKRVPSQRLADLVLPGESIGFIKIDVEGHELAVLSGSAELLETMRPVILLEAEERHRPNAVISVWGYLRQKAYVGLMLRGDILEPIENFNVERHQSVNFEQAKALDLGLGRPPNYVNNFIFLPKLTAVSET